MYLNQKKLTEEDFCYFDSTQYNDQGILQFFKAISDKNFKTLSAKWFVSLSKLFSN
jgi:hypothetical protein